MNSGNAGTPTTTSIGGGNHDPLEWYFLQCFGERTPGEEIQEADIISALEFDHDGQHLATGDRGGRVVLFERIPSQQRPVLDPDQRNMYNRPSPFEYRYLTEFQSHEPEFDYLKSLEIEEKINKVRWCRVSNGALFLLSANDKTIKLWKVYEKKVLNLANFNIEYPNGQAPTSNSLTNGAQPGTRFNQHNQPQQQPGTLRLPLHLPQVTSTELVLAARCKRIYANAHTYHVNSIAINSDQETFLSADDLRVNLWNLRVTDQSFNVVDIKPDNMEDLTEVITSADFHPRDCHTFAYSSSKGCIYLSDMRDSALCDTYSKHYEEAEQQGNKSFFSEIISSISDIKFSSDGQLIVSRDYMTAKVWDLRMESGPVAKYNVHEALRGRLCDLYENDHIFDKFDCCISGDNRHIATGSYSNVFRAFQQSNGADFTLEASRDPLRASRQPAGRGRGGRARAPAEPDTASADWNLKLLHLAWHPNANVIAAAASNSLYMYCAR